MIYLPVSEAYAYDHLAILYVKQEHGIVDHAYRDSVIDSLISQLGDEMHVKALNSSQFHDLLVANRSVWSMVDKATRDECPASEVDAANQRRYAAKKALQERFWPASPLSEVKSKRPNDLEPERLSSERAIKQFESIMEEVRKAIQPIMDKGKDLQPEQQKPTVPTKSQGGAA